MVQKAQVLMQQQAKRRRVQPILWANPINFLKMYLKDLI